MKSLLLLFIALAINSLLAQNPNGWPEEFSGAKIQDIQADNPMLAFTQYIYDANQGLLVPLDSIRLLYNANDQQIRHIAYLYDENSATWTLSRSARYEYHHSNLIKSTIREYWDSTSMSWVNETKISTSYDAQDRATYSLTQRWNRALASWQDSIQTTTVWHNAPVPHPHFLPIEEQLTQNWDKVSQTWQNSYRLTNSFDSAGNLVDQYLRRWGNVPEHRRTVRAFNSFQQDTAVFEFLFDESSQKWLKAFKRFKSYQGTGFLDNHMETVHNWDSVNYTGWANHSRHTITLDARGNVVDLVSEAGVNYTTWVLSSRFQYSWDWNIDKTTQVSQLRWDVNTMAWVPLTRSEYDFDTDGDPVAYSFDLWDETLMQWKPSVYWTYYYQLPATPLEPDYQPPQIHVYPNPVQNRFQLKLNLQLPGDVSIQIRDLTGKNLAHMNPGIMSTGEHLFTFDLGAYSRGIYTIVVYLDDKLAVQEILRL